MSINYSQLFQTIGTFLSPLNRLRKVAKGGTDASYGTPNPDLPSRLSTIQSTVGGFGYYDILANVPAAMAGVQDQVAGQCKVFQGLIESALSNKTVVLNNLFLGTNPTVPQIVAALFADMVAYSQTVLKNTITIGSVGTGGLVIGNGKLFTTATLDGYNPPWNGGVSIPGYAGLTSEMAPVSDTVQILCVNDSYTGGVAVGAEKFKWTGAPLPGNPYDWRGGGSGAGPTFPLLNSYSTVLNKDFETFTVTNTPDNWTMLSGILPGTHVFKDTSTLYRGAAAMKLVGDGVKTNVGVKQAVSVAQLGLKPNQSVALSVAIKSDTTFSGPVTFSATFAGTGWAGITLTKNLVGIGSSWTLLGGDAVLPAVIPSDLTLTLQVIEVAGMESGKRVWVDSVALGPTTYHGGIGVYAVAGSLPYAKGDQFQFTLANDLAGVFQGQFVRAYQMQLPSVTSSPSITESWGVT